MTTTDRDHAPTETTPTLTDAPGATGRRVLAVLGATAAALAVWTIAVPLGGADLTVPANGASRPVGPGAVVTAALLAGLAGWALRAALERVGRNPRRTWTVVSAGVLALSLAGPLGAGARPAATLALVGMHLAVGAVLVPALRR